MSTAVVWFRKCLRLHDNFALQQVSEDNRIRFMLPVFILDPKVVGPRFENLSNNRLRFLFENLEDLDSRLKARCQNPLVIFFGPPTEVVESLLEHLKESLSYFSSDYCSEPHGEKPPENFEVFELTQLLITSLNSHTILDLEKTVTAKASATKSMKDIEKSSDCIPMDKRVFQGSINRAANLKVHTKF